MRDDHVCDRFAEGDVCAYGATAPDADPSSAVAPAENIANIKIRIDKQFADLKWLVYVLEAGITQQKQGWKRAAEDAETEVIRLRKDLEAARERVEELEEMRSTDICGLCGESGADKMAHPVHWPGEQVPDGPFVHRECEDAECGRAHSLLSDKQREEFLRSI